MFSEHGIVIRNNKERENMTDTFFATSIEHLVTTKDGDTLFIVSSNLDGSEGDTAKESEANAIAGLEKRKFLIKMN